MGNKPSHHGKHLALYFDLLRKTMVKCLPATGAHITYPASSIVIFSTISSACCISNHAPVIYIVSSRKAMWYFTLHLVKRNQIDTLKYCLSVTWNRVCISNSFLDLRLHCPWPFHLFWCKKFNTLAMIVMGSTTRQFHLTNPDRKRQPRRCRGSSIWRKPFRI